MAFYAGVVFRYARHSGQLRRSTRLLSSPTRSFSMIPKPEYHEGGGLEGTAPYHQCFIVLHSSQPPSSFSKVHQTPVSRELLARSRTWKAKTAINFAWRENFATHQSSGSSEKQVASVYSYISGRLMIPDVSLENMDEVERQILDHLAAGPVSPSVRAAVDVFVCTHGSRDCRCGERGQAVYEALLEAVAEHQREDKKSMAKRIRIGAVGHVGGHAYAANVLIYPQGEWLGSVKPEHAPSIVKGLCQKLSLFGVGPSGPSHPPFSLPHWRGRMGLASDEAKRLFEKHDYSAWPITGLQKR